MIKTRITAQQNYPTKNFKLYEISLQKLLQKSYCLFADNVILSYYPGVWCLLHENSHAYVTKGGNINPV